MSAEDIDRDTNDAGGDSASRSLPLEGLVVVACEQAVAGPLATRHLALCRRILDDRVRPVKHRAKVGHARPDMTDKRASKRLSAPARGGDRV